MLDNLVYLHISFLTTIKPVHVVTSIKQSPLLKGHMNRSSFKRSPVLYRRGRGRMVVGFTTTCTISAYRH